MESMESIWNMVGSVKYTESAMGELFKEASE